MTTRSRLGALRREILADIDLDYVALGQTDSELDAHGLDAHEIKDEVVPGQGNRYDIYKDAEGNLYAVRKGKGGEPPIPTGDRILRQTDAVGSQP